MYKEKVSYVVQKHLIRLLWAPLLVGGILGGFAWTATNLSQTVFGGKFGSYSPLLFGALGACLAALLVGALFVGALRRALRPGSDAQLRVDDGSGLRFSFERFVPAGPDAVPDPPSPSHGASLSGGWRASSAPRSKG